MIVPFHIYCSIFHNLLYKITNVSENEKYFILHAKLILMIVGVI